LIDPLCHIYPGASFDSIMDYIRLLCVFYLFVRFTFGPGALSPGLVVKRVCIEFILEVFWVAFTC